MKTILCYGDSNTWGYVPGSGKRYAESQRWTGVMQNLLGDSFRVVEEGLNARTTVLDDPTRAFRNGKEYLIPCLDSHAPIDVIILMLGTNDLKHRFGLSAFDIGANIATLIEMMRQSSCWRDGQPPKILLVAPPPVGKLAFVNATNFPEIFAGAKEKSEVLGRVYENIATKTGCLFLNSEGIITSSDVDGIHFDLGDHEKLGTALARRTRELFNKG